MKPKFLLLSTTFTLFCLVTELNGPIGAYLSGQSPLVFLFRADTLLETVSGLLVFGLDSVIAYALFYGLYYRKGQKVAAIVAYFGVGIPVMIGLRYLVQEVGLNTLIDYHNYSAAMRTPVRYFADNIFYAIYYSAYGLVFFFIQLSVHTQQEQQELRLQNRTAELAFLRSQINPHFLFNSLNNVYTLVYQQSDRALPAISKLSELLRYMLYEKADAVPLEKEVRYLRDFIDLQRMRHNFEPALAVGIDLPETDTFRMAPLTLIPFVENAFKHGDLRDPNHPLTIDLMTHDNRMDFRVKNKISSYQKDETGGVGLNNVRKRLDLIYGASHTLTIDNDGRTFCVNLSITTL